MAGPGAAGNNLNFLRRNEYQDNLTEVDTVKKLDDTLRYEKLRERMGNGDVDRRTFVQLLGCAGLVAGVSGSFMMAASRSAMAAARELYFEGWGGVVRPCARTPSILTSLPPATRSSTRLSAAKTKC